MNASGKNQETGKLEVATRVAELSKLLGMVPSEEGGRLREPLTQREMMLPEWLDAARDSFLKLSLSISRELDIELR